MITNCTIGNLQRPVAAATPETTYFATPITLNIRGCLGKSQSLFGADKENRQRAEPNVGELLIDSFDVKRALPDGFEIGDRLGILTDDGDVLNLVVNYRYKHIGALGHWQLLLRDP